MEAVATYKWKPTVSKTSIPFRGFDEQGEIRIYHHGILPHWRQAGCTYFVSFRLADSIPKHVLQALEEERTLWLKARGIESTSRDWKRPFAALSAKEKRQYEQLVGRLVNKSLDECHGSCALREPGIAKHVASALDYFHGTRVLTGNFVVMPNHVHALLTPMDSFELEDILHSIKSFTANEINRVLGQTGQFWQRESYDHLVRDTEQLQAYQEYIKANPTKAKLSVGEYILAQAEYHVEAT